MRPSETATTWSSDRVEAVESEAESGLAASVTRGVITLLVSRNMRKEIAVKYFAQGKARWRCWH
jgi:hypothetical protein